MPEKYTYLLVDFFCIVFPLLFSFHPRLQFYKQWRFFLPSCLFTAILFLVWDALFTAWGIWSFNPQYVLGFYFLGMPLEELLFFICIPYACVFSYYCFYTLFPALSSAKGSPKYIAIAIAVLLLVVAALNMSRLYTSVTFLCCAVCLLYTALVIRAKYLGVFFFTFLFILIPFVLSNGVLTGSFIARTVVSYNNDYNLGIRLLTIPLEDVFYGLLLLLLNVSGFEYLKKKFRPKVI